MSDCSLAYFFRAGNFEPVQLCHVRLWDLCHCDALGMLPVAAARLCRIGFRLSSLAVLHRRSDYLDPDAKIVAVSTGFATCTGYKPSEVLGRNCRFLQGPDTVPKAVNLIRQALRTVRIMLLHHLPEQPRDSRPRLPHVRMRVQI